MTVKENLTVKEPVPHCEPDPRNDVGVTAIGKGDVNSRAVILGADNIQIRNLIRQGADGVENLGTDISLREVLNQLIKTFDKFLSAL